MTQYSSEFDHSADEGMNRDIIGLLHRHYPRHPWTVETRHGLVVIRHGLFGPKWGMVRHFRDLAHDARQREREVVVMGGEFLERGGLPRGGWDGVTMPTALEGLPRWKPDPRATLAWQSQGGVEIRKPMIVVPEAIAGVVPEAIAGVVPGVSDGA